MNKSPVFDGVCVTQYLVFGVVFWDLFFCLLFLHDVVCFLSVLVVFNTYFCINRHQQHKEKTFKIYRRVVYNWKTTRHDSSKMFTYYLIFLLYINNCNGTYSPSTSQSTYIVDSSLFFLIMNMHDIFSTLLKANNNYSMNLGSIIKDFLITALYNWHTW